MICFVTYPFVFVSTAKLHGMNQLAKRTHFLTLHFYKKKIWKCVTLCTHSQIPYNEASNILYKSSPILVFFYRYTIYSNLFR